MPHLALGTQGWAYRDWVGPFYELGTRPDAYLARYAQEFGSVEVDSTFYGTPAPDRLVRWSRRVPRSFTFALKFPREITHERRLVDCTALSAEFFTVAAVLGPQLEAVLVQLPPDFRPPEWAALAAFVPTLPSGPRIALEVRDPAWFEPGMYRELTALLRAHTIALAVSDGTFVERNLMLAALRSPTAAFAYIRWMGRRDAVTRFNRVVIDRETEIERWSQMMRSAANGLERICGYANNHYMGHSPATIRALYRALGIEREPPLRSMQTELFPPEIELEEH